LNDDANRARLRWQLFDLAREDDRYKNVINEKRTKINYKRQADIGELWARFDTSREKGDDRCSSERELNHRVCRLHFRTGCAKNTFIEEKQLLKKIKQLEETRQEMIANDALKQKRFNDSMQWVGRPIYSDRYGCNSCRKQINLKNVEEKWKSMNNEITSLELKLARAVKKRTSEEKLLVKLKEQRSEEVIDFIVDALRNLNYNLQYYNKYKSLLNNVRKLVANPKNIVALEELSYKEVSYGIRHICLDVVHLT
ncbi:hypothetical protein MKW92_031899, partial [Papaver armeniacum]